MPTERFVEKVHRCHATTITFLTTSSVAILPPRLHLQKREANFFDLVLKDHFMILLFIFISEVIFLIQVVSVALPTSPSSCQTGDITAQRPTCNSDQPVQQVKLEGQ